MNNILFSANAANQINESVQRKIAPHLFIFCNYEPTPLQVFSEDAKFTIAILNFYKLLIDSSIINRIIAKNGLAKQNNIRINWFVLQKITDEINAFRTLLGHNQSEKNGTDENLYQFARWKKSCIGKEDAETPEDYRIMLNKLETNARTCMQIIKDFVNKASSLSLSQKNILINQWEKEIIRYYCKGKTNQYIFWGQLKGVYYSEHPEEKEYDLSGEGRHIDFKFADWIRGIMMSPMDIQNRSLCSLFQTVQEESIRKKIADKINDNQQKMEQIKRLVSDFKKSPIENLNPYDFQDYYFSLLEQKLYSAVEIIKTQSQDIGTMLPQDIMPYIIKSDIKDGVLR